MMQTNETAVILVIGLVVAVFVEVLKHTKLNERLSSQLVQLLTLALGLIGGMVAMYYSNGEFAEYVFIGFAGAIASSGLYELVKTLSGGKVTTKVGE